MTEDDDQQAAVWVVLIGAMVLAIGLALGVGVSRALQPASVSGTAVQTAVAAGSEASLDPSAADASAVASTQQAAATGAEDAADTARVLVEGELVKFYFATGKTDLAEGAQEALGVIIKGVATGQTAVISGFHDATGDLAINQELAKQRADAVADALKSLGVNDDKIELRKPEDTEADGTSLAEARRVEVRLE